MASLTAIILLPLLLVISFDGASAQLIEENLINSGTTLSPDGSAWFSVSKRFAFGFFPEGTGYRVGIYIVGSQKNVTVVWTANRDKPPVSSTATVEFVNGKIQLMPDGQSIAASSDSELAVTASMLDSGNFVLYNGKNDIIWQSFNVPTDSLLGGQVIRSGNQLVSSTSPKDHSTGRFRLKMQYDGNVVAYPVNTKDDFTDAYLVYTPITYLGKNYELQLNGTGRLLLMNLKTNQGFKELATVPSYKTVIYRATLDYDGNFRLYSHISDAEGNSNMSREWEAISDLCLVKGVCGYNSFCTRMDGEPRCNCIPGFNLTDPNENFSGCERSFRGQRCINGKEDTTLNNIIAAEGLAWDDYPYFVASLPEKQDCNLSCSEDCDCDAALYSGSGVCRKYKLPLKYVKGPNVSTTPDTFIAFFKLSGFTFTGESNPEKLPWVTILSLSLGFVTYSCIALGIFMVLIFRLHIRKYRKQLIDTGKTSLTDEFTLRKCTYNDLKKATDGFKEELGKGAFGAVYKGTFDKGKNFVAVKKLEKVVDEGEREFRAEMRAIGRTRHKNLVRLLGYCIEGSKRLLVYEYMSHGSLADNLYRVKARPIWQERVRIALDVARGILYLHEGCEAPIIHCDIKPQNILLDKFLTAKISDFGLAKFLMPDQTRTLTGARGTRGYMAPEWDKNHFAISLKVDIYSFGIVLLEIICCRRYLEVNITSPEATLLPFWAYECFASRKLDKLVNGEDVDKKTFERMVAVALWCIQEEPALRFPMKTVVLMLEGTIDVPIPPCPTSNSSSNSQN